MATCTIPVAINDKVMTDCSVAEPSAGETLWTSGATFALGDKVILGSPSATVTISVASPGVVNWTAHGLPDGTQIILTTTGALPTGLTAGEIYYVVNRTTDAFQLSETVDGVSIITTGSQSGTHTALASIHRVYRSVTGSNTGHPPAIDDGTNWFDLGPTNLYAMLDLYRPSTTWAASPLTFTLDPGEMIRSIFFGSLVATHIDVAQKVDGVTVKSWSRDLYTRQTFNFTDYCFKKFDQQSSVQIFDLLLYANATIEVTISRDVGMVGVGEVVIGNPVYLGKAQYGAQRKNRNYTKFDRNADGTPQPPVRRRNVPVSSLNIMFNKANARALQRLAEDVNGVVAVWSALDDDTHPYFEPTLIMGIATTFDLDFTHPENGYLTLVAEEY